MAELGSIPVAMGWEEAARFHAAEIPKWAELVRLSGARLEQRAPLVEPGAARNSAGAACLRTPALQEAMT
jgi:hypothetical protein